MRTAKLYALYGTLTDADVEAVKRYVINPVESREASLAKPETLAEELASQSALRPSRALPPWTRPRSPRCSPPWGLPMDIADLKALQDYFRETSAATPP